MAKAWGKSEKGGNRPDGEKWIFTVVGGQREEDFKRKNSELVTEKSKDTLSTKGQLRVTSRLNVYERRTDRRKKIMKGGESRERKRFILQVI